MLRVRRSLSERGSKTGLNGYSPPSAAPSFKFGELNFHELEPALRLAQALGRPANGRMNVLSFYDEHRIVIDHLLTDNDGSTAVGHSITRSSCI